jgi:alpha-ribazole phosphatase
MSTSARIDILRHGDTPLTGRFCGRSDPILTDKGWQDLQRQVEGTTWDRIISSPAKRCHIFAESLPSPTTLDERFWEMDFGSWESMSTQEVWDQDQETLKAFWADPTATPAPGGEPWAAVCSRVAGAFEEIALAAQGKRVLLVTHAGVMRSLLVTQLGLSFASAWKVALPTASILRMTVTHDVEHEALHVELNGLETAP